MKTTTDSEQVKRLDIEKVWTGDGFGTVEAILLLQIKRKGNVAMYSVSKKRTPNIIRGYEVFRFKTILKGTPLPGNAVVEQSYEQYPGTSMFGKTAWAGTSRIEAEQKFTEFVAKANAVNCQ